MTERQFTVEDIEDMIYQLGVLITDASQGILITTLKKNFFEEYKKFDTITAWECFVDQVNRIQSVVELHDFLAECIEPPHPERGWGFLNFFHLIWLI